MRIMNRFLPLLVLSLVAACATGSRGGAAAGEVETFVTVENRSWNQVVVYAVRGGAQRLRIGSVPATTNQELKLPRGLVNGATQLRFIVDPIGGSAAPVSHEITVYPGDNIRLQVPPR